MKKMIGLISFCGIAFSATSTLAHPPSTLNIYCSGSAPAHCETRGGINKSSLETLAIGAGKSDQFLVLYASDNQHRCVISKAAAAKQGVSIEMLNEFANKYQVDVTCAYVFPLQPNQISANSFSFRASVR